MCADGEDAGRLSGDRRRRGAPSFTVSRREASSLSLERARLEKLQREREREKEEVGTR